MRLSCHKLLLYKGSCTLLRKTSVLHMGSLISFLDFPEGPAHHAIIAAVVPETPRVTFLSMSPGRNDLLVALCVEALHKYKPEILCAPLSFCKLAACVLHSTNLWRRFCPCMVGGSMPWLFLQVFKARASIPSFRPSHERSSYVVWPQRYWTPGRRLSRRQNAEPRCHQSGVV